MAGPLVVTFQALTPIWTGDANHKGSRIRETGVLGSLRWWYEAIIRGMNRFACDTTSGSCVYAKAQGMTSICLVCQLFGCTGYSRRFRFVVHGGGASGDLVEVRLKNPGTPNHRGWRIPSQVPRPFTLAFTPMRPGALGSFEVAALCHTLCLIERYGALGAKASHGQGVVRVTNWGKLSDVRGLDTWVNDVQALPAKDSKNPPNAPSLADFVGVTVTVDSAATRKANWWNVIPLNRPKIADNSLWVASAPAVRAQLRSWLRSTTNIPGFTGDLQRERHRLMGTIRQPVGPKGSDIFVTHLYQSDGRWTMRIFGFVPIEGSPVNQAVCDLLQDKAVLASQIQSALGGLQVDVAPYPESILSLPTGAQKGSQDG